MGRAGQESRVDKALITEDLEAKVRSLGFIPNTMEYFKEV